MKTEDSCKLEMNGQLDGEGLSSLRLLLDPSREENRTIFTLVKDEQVPVVKQVLETVVGDLQAPDTAILFTIPVEDIEGVKF